MPRTTNETPVPGGGGGPAAAVVWGEVVEAFAGLDSAVGRVLSALAAAAGQEGLPVGPVELDWLTTEAARVAARGERVRGRSFDVLRAARQAGRVAHDDDAQFVAAKTGRAAGQTRREAELAGALAEPPPVAPGQATGQPGPSIDGAGGGTGGGPAGDRVLRPLARAVDAGLVDADRALVVVRELEALPDHVTPAERLRAEEVLTVRAQKLSVRALRRAARRVLEDLGYTTAVADTHENTRVAAQEDKAWAAASFWIREEGDGTMTGRFTLPVLQGRMLAKVLQAMTSPRRLARHRTTTTATADGQEGLPWGEREVDWAHEQGKAFAELVSHLPTDHLSTPSTAILLVRTDLDTLRGVTDRVGVTDHDEEVSAGQVRRLAATAGIVPVVMGSDSAVLDLGRQTRVFTDSQRKALAVTYSTCAEEHCDRPFAWCEIHHDTPWTPRRTPRAAAEGPPPGTGAGTAPPRNDPDHPDHPDHRGDRGDRGAKDTGGGTDLANAIPLCGRHHRRLDDPRYTHTTTTGPDGATTVHFHTAHP